MKTSKTTATIMAFFIMMTFLSSCAQKMCYKYDSNGNVVYDNNGNPITYECNSTNSNNSNSNWNGGVLTSAQRLIPVADAIPSFYAETNRAFTDNNHDGIADYTINPFTGDKSYKKDKIMTAVYSLNQQGTPIVSSYAIMEDADARNFANGGGNAKYQVMTFNGIKYYVVTVVVLNTIICYQSIDQYDRVVGPFNFQVK